MLFSLSNPFLLGAMWIDTTFTLLIFVAKQEYPFQKLKCYENLIYQAL